MRAWDQNLPHRTEVGEIIQPERDAANRLVLHYNRPQPIFLDFSP